MRSSPVRLTLVARFASRVRLVVGLAATCLAVATPAFPAQVSGKVVDDGGAPRAGARVRFEPGGKSATTSQDGEFTVDDLTDGTYTVTVQSGGGTPQQFKVTVKTGRLSPETLKLQKPAEQRVSGRVIDRDEKGLVGLRVSISAHKGETVLTDSDGRFFVSALPGAYKITVKSQSKTQDFDVTVADGRLTPNEFTF